VTKLQIFGFAVLLLAQMGALLAIAKAVHRLADILDRKAK
jgi:hypothetical protein